MARGWESKSIEQQQEEVAEEATRRKGRMRLSLVEQRRNRERENLELARKRLVDQLEKARRAEHQQMLQQSLAEVERQLASFDDITGGDARK
jgi:uncharacterized membrane protein YccC